MFLQSQDPLLSWIFSQVGPRIAKNRTTNKTWGYNYAQRDLEKMIYPSGHTQRYCCNNQPYQKWMPSARNMSSWETHGVMIKHLRCNPDVDPRLNSVDITTPFNMFARGGNGFFPLLRYIDVATPFNILCQRGCRIFNTYSDKWNVQCWVWINVRVGANMFVQRDVSGETETQKVMDAEPRVGSSLCAFQWWSYPYHWRIWVSFAVSGWFSVSKHAFRHFFSNLFCCSHSITFHFLLIDSKPFL